MKMQMNNLKINKFTKISLLFSLLFSGIWPLYDFLGPWYAKYVFRIGLFIHFVIVPISIIAVLRRSAPKFIDYVLNVPLILLGLYWCAYLIFFILVLAPWFAGMD